MSRFVEVNGVFINADSIKYYYQDTHNRLHIEFADGTGRIAGSFGRFIKNHLSCKIYGLNELK